MWTYILKRLLLMIPTLFGIVLVTFIVLQLVPGGPVERMLAQLRASSRGRESGAANLALHVDQRTRTEIQQEHIEYLQKLYGFDKPVYVQFGTWLVRLFTFDFGESYYRHQKVVDLVLEKLPVSISLGAWSFVLTYLTCIPLGIRKAVRHGSRFDAISSMLILVGYSIPGFVLGIFCALRWRVILVGVSSARAHIGRICPIALVAEGWRLSVASSPTPHL
jgi:microcin C transport system permease protein